VAGTSPDSHKANKASKEEQGRNLEENSRSKLSTPGNQTSQAGLVKPMQPAFMASSDEANARTKDDEVLIRQTSIYVDEEIVNMAEAKTTV
jgi:hypothetical protein